jgi:probable rRNA maturation factor
MAVRLVVRDGPYEGVDPREVARRARAMMRLIKRHRDELSILLTDDRQMREMNKIYRNKDRSTDVLAFAMNEGEFPGISRGLLGDVVISVPTAERQARARRAPVLEEVTLLLAHGLLHLTGWDHDTPAKDRAMRKEAARLVHGCCRNGDSSA